MDAIEEYKKKKETNPNIEKSLIVKSKEESYSSDLVGNQELNIKQNSKMTENNEIEQKAFMKSVTDNLKTLTENYESVLKENVSLKESVAKMTESIEKITKALERPIHKSPGIQINDAEIKANVQIKSVDPLSLFR
jgi:hypothetical protein